MFDRLYDFEPFEFRVPEREWFAFAGLLVGSAEMLRFGPGNEIFLRRPYRVR